MAGPDTASQPSGRHLRNQLLRWARSRPDAASHGAAATAAAALYAVCASLEVALYGVPVPAGLLLPAAQFGSLVLALRRRVLAVAVFTVATIALTLWTQPSSVPWPWTMTGIICFALLVGTVWTVAGWRCGTLAYLTPLLVLSVVATVRPEAMSVANMLVASGVGAAAGLVGALLHEWARISRQLTLEREHAATEIERRVIIEERQRIARELHDVVAHGLSLIQVQAQFARYRHPHLPDDVGLEVEEIARTARTALGEMRQMLGALRGDEPAARAPQPTLDDLPELVNDAARAGASIRLRLDAPADTPTAVGIAAYRIAQEGISNAVRHAPGAPIEVSAGAHDGQLYVAIENGAGNEEERERGVRGRGHGLIGMRARASMFRGTLSAESTASRGFRVVAALPLGEHPSADDTSPTGPEPVAPREAGG